jgi:hypothetical protein
MKKLLLLGAFWCLAQTSYAFVKPASNIFTGGEIELKIANPASPQDTIRIKIGNDKEIVIYVADKEALEELQAYDLNQMISDIINEADAEEVAQEKEIVIITDEDNSKYRIRITTSDDVEIDEDIDVEEIEDVEEVVIIEEDMDDEDEEVTYTEWPSKKEKKPFQYDRTTSSIVFDLGFNNLITPGDDFTQNGVEYDVKNWGSWYVGIGNMFQTHIGGPVALQWGGNISWYNFKFEDEQISLRKQDNMAMFYDYTAGPENSIEADKSKLTVTHLNLNFVPMLDFGYKTEEVEVDGVKTKVKKYHGDAFRIGFGGYAGYRVDSYTKRKFTEDGDEDKKRDHDSFYLNNWRYGLRLQVGIKGMDIFANYDLNEMFKDGRGPELNAFSIGITL